MLRETLERHRWRIIREWALRLHSEVSERYASRPIEELFSTCREATDANFAMLVEGDYSKIDAFIEKIAKMRLQAGFPLSDVQRAFELYRSVLLPILLEELEGGKLYEALKRLNDGLCYTICKFSDYFQSLHEQQIKEYASDLEREVEKRTRELVESENKYRLLVEEMNDGYFVVQGERIVFANRAFCDMHGYEPEEVLQKPYTGFIAPESLEEVKKAFKRLRQRTEGGSLVVYLRLHRDGRRLPTESKVKVINYQRERAVAGICRDITERVEMERRMRESERLAHLGRLAAMLAHEIRNPLSSIKINIQVLLNKLNLNGNDKRRMEIMAHELARLERILEEMLDLGRPVPLELRPASLNAVVEASIGVLEGKIQEKKLLVRKHLQRRLPRVLLDPDRLEQALINVLLNSIEVLPEGGQIDVSTRLLRDGDPSGSLSVEVKVEDNGPGVPESDLPFIFDPFFSKKGKGTGLGLTTVKRIVEAHGGQVKAMLRRPTGLSVVMQMPVRRMT